MYAIRCKRPLVFSLLLAVVLVGLGAGALATAAPANAGSAAAPLAGPPGSSGSLFALLAVQQAQLTAADGAAGDCLGYTVAISGDAAVVGANSDDVGANPGQGSAYIFVRSGDSWNLQATLTAADGAAGDGFGYSVAVSGDTAVVGAARDDVGANSGQGSAYVFTRSGSAWSQQAKLTASDGAAYDGLGDPVTIDGDTVVVGAARDDVGANSDQGSAYVFTRSGSTWSQQAKLTASDGATIDRFGCSVTIAGDTAVVGAHWNKVGANAGQGSAYVFTRSGSTWSQQAKLTASDGAGGDLFGWSVAIFGDTVVVGAPNGDVGGNPDQGSAYVFTRSGTTWSQQARLTASDGAVSDVFGRSVAVTADTAVVGAPADDDGTHENQGSAYIFARSGTSWSRQAKLTASDGAGGDQFGCSVAIFGDTAVVGACYDNVDGNTDQGSAYVFTRSGTTWSQQAKLTADDSAASDYFGSSVAISGETAVVGAPWDDVGANADQGSAYIFVRSGDSWNLEATLTAADGADGDGFGNSVAIDGDTAVVSAPDDTVGANDLQGSAYVFTRSGTTWSQQAKLTSDDGTEASWFGNSVAISGETAVVGESHNTVGAKEYQGAAYVFTRSGTTWSQQAKLTASDGAAYDSFGYSVAISGVTTVVGTSMGQGSAYVFTRSGTTWSQQAKLTASDGATNDWFGESVAISGETAVVGSPGDEVGSNTDQGSAYVFTRSGTTWSQQATLTGTDGHAGDYFGKSVAIFGETAVAGAPRRTLGANAEQGSAYIFTRSGTTWSRQAKLNVDGSVGRDHFGFSVAISGETAAVGAPYDDVGANADQGSAYVFSDLLAKPGTAMAKSPRGLISSRTPTFRWRVAAGTLSYEVRVYKGSRLIRKKTGITTTSWKCTRRLPPGVRLTWKVRARNAAGWGVWSSRPWFKVR